MAKARILIVEDESVIALDLSEHLSSLDYQVVAMAATGQDAVAKALDLKPDLVLSDIVLRGPMDGITAAAQIKDLTGIPVVFLTAHADDATLCRVQITEPYGYIVKPFKVSELHAVIELALYKYRLATERTCSAVVQPFGLPPSFDRRGQGVDLLGVLRRIDFFASVDEGRLRELADACRIQNYRAREYISFEGEEQPIPFIVVSGRVAMSKSSSDGKELIVELLPPGDLFGLVIAMERQPSSLSARAQVDSAVLWIPKASFILLLEEFHFLHRSFTEYVSHRLRLSHELSRALAHDLVEARVASILCSLVERFVGRRSDNGGYVIEMTRQELAALAGNSLETTIRITKAMERDGILNLSRRGRIDIIDIERLRQAAEGSG